jgi:hypothetical protein
MQADDTEMCAAARGWRAWVRLVPVSAKAPDGTKLSVFRPFRLLRSRYLKWNVLGQERFLGQLMVPLHYPFSSGHRKRMFPKRALQCRRINAVSEQSPREQMPLPGYIKRNVWVNTERQCFLPAFKAVVVAPVPMIIWRD